MDSLHPILERLQALGTLYGGAPAYGLVVLLLVACGFGAPISEDLLLIGAAILTLQGVMDPYILSITTAIGVIAGDLLLFHWGKKYGMKILNLAGVKRLVPPHKLARAQAIVQRHGAKQLFFTRFLPGLRTTSYFVAGTMKLPYRSLLLYDGVAAFIEVPLVIFGVRFLGGNFDQIKELLVRFQYAVLAMVGLGLIYFFIRPRLAKSWAKR